MYNRKYVLSLLILLMMVAPTSPVFALGNNTSNLTLSNEQPKLLQCSNGAVIRSTEKCPIPTEGQLHVNFTEIFSSSSFEDCFYKFTTGNEIDCSYPVKVLHQGPNLLVLKSDINFNPHLIWSAVVVAKSYGYKVDNVAYAAYTSSGEPSLRYENVIVTMSK